MQGFLIFVVLFGCLSVDLSASTRWIFVHFFCFFTEGFPDFRLPRAPEQGGAPRLPAEEAAAAGACAPAPANSANPGLERMLTEMERQCGWKERGDKEGRDGRRRKTDWERESGGWVGGVGGGGWLMGWVVRNLSRRQGARNEAIVRRNYIYNGLSTHVLGNNEGVKGGEGKQLDWGRKGRVVWAKQSACWGHVQWDAHVRAGEGRGRRVGGGAGERGRGEHEYRWEVGRNGRG